MNTLVTGVFGLGLSALQGVRVIHQTGPDDVKMVEASYRENGIEATVSPFFRDMAKIYEEADLLVSRAGATTLAELAVLGKPAILIPYPYAADQHQEKNAEYYVQGGGALMFVEKELTVERLGESLAQLLTDRQALETMGAAMRSSGFPDAAEHIVDVCMNLLGNQSPHSYPASTKE